MFNAKYLTAANIATIEEAMNTEDVEHMIATIDQIVALKLQKALTPDSDIRNADRLKRRGQPVVTKPTKKQEPRR